MSYTYFEVPFGDRNDRGQDEIYYVVDRRIFEGVGNLDGYGTAEGACAQLERDLKGCVFRREPALVNRPGVVAAYRVARYYVVRYDRVVGERATWHEVMREPREVGTFSVGSEVVEVWYEPGSSHDTAEGAIKAMRDPDLDDVVIHHRGDLAWVDGVIASQDQP